MKGVNEHIENFNSEPCGRHFGHLLFSKERETGDQFGRTIQPKYGMFTYAQIWLKLSLTLKISYPTSASGIIVLLKTPKRIAIFELPSCFR